MRQGVADATVEKAENGAPTAIAIHEAPDVPYLIILFVAVLVAMVATCAVM